MTEGEILLTFGENLRRLIKARGISANKLAKCADIPRRNIFRYLAFETIPRADNLAKLCTALHCSLGDLYGGTV